MSRRELARMAAAVAAARALPLGAQAPPPSDAAQDRPTGYIGPLTGITTGLDDRRFDPVAYTRDRYSAAPRRLRFQARTRVQAEEWQKTLRAKITELVGGFPSDHQPLRPVTLEVRQFAGYRREKIAFDSRPGVSVLAYLLLPEKTQPPAATVICVPGHGRGVDDIVGIDERGFDRTDKAGYQHDFAIQVAEAGMAAVAIEPMAFGCRRDPLNARQGLSRKGCEPTAGGALLLGETMIAWRVWDVMRTIDYIATRPDLNANRVGCMGISGGGTATLFSAALEPRIRAAMVSGLSEHVPGQHRQPRALHRQLRAGDSELGRDARHRGIDCAASALRGVRREGQHLPNRREHRELHTGARDLRRLSSRGSSRAGGVSRRAFILGEARHPVHGAASLIGRL